MIHTTIWHPDTCGCVLSYSWDDAVPADQRVHTPVDHDGSACTVHGAFASVAAAHARVGDENTRKNLTLGAAVAEAAARFPALLDPNGVQFKDGVATFQYDASGLLTVTITGMTAQRKIALQAAADQRFGAGKVLVQ